MTSTQDVQSVHNAANLTELYAIKDAANYLRNRRRLAGAGTPLGRRHAIATADRMILEAFEVAERTRTAAGPLPDPFDTVTGTVTGTVLEQRREDDVPRIIAAAVTSGAPVDLGWHA